MEIVGLAQVDPAEVEALLDRAFAPGRRARTAYRIRAGAEAVPELSFAALDVAPDRGLVGTIQCWPVALHEPGHGLGTDAGASWPLVMVGPVAVEPERQGLGVGRALMAQALAAAAQGGLDGALMLIGDPEYYGRFGFTDARTGRWEAPGPFERRRLLARGHDVPDAAGMLGPR